MQTDAATMTSGTTDVSRLPSGRRARQFPSEGIPEASHRSPMLLVPRLEDPCGKGVLDKFVRVDVRPKYDEEFNRCIHHIGAVQFIFHATSAYRSFMTSTDRYHPSTTSFIPLLGSEHRSCRAPCQCTGNLTAHKALSHRIARRAPYMCPTIAPSPQSRMRRSLARCTEIPLARLELDHIRSAPTTSRLAPRLDRSRPVSPAAAVCSTTARGGLTWRAVEYLNVKLDKL